MPISDLLEITGEKSRRIVELWQRDVLSQLELSVPVASGTLKSALLVAHTVTELPGGKGWMAGIGDASKVGVTVHTMPPPHTITEFLKWWWETPEGKKQAEEIEYQRRKRQQDRDTAAIQRAARRILRGAEREFARTYFESVEKIEKRLRKISRARENIILRREGAIFDREGEVVRSGLRYGARERFQYWSEVRQRLVADIARGRVSPRVKTAKGVPRSFKRRMRTAQKKETMWWQRVLSLEREQLAAERRMERLRKYQARLTKRYTEYWRRRQGRR